MPFRRRKRKNVYTTHPLPLPPSLSVKEAEEKTAISPLLMASVKTMEDLAKRDLVWFAANHAELHLSHLKQRMIQSSHLRAEEAPLSKDKLLDRAAKAIEKLDAIR